VAVNRRNEFADAITPTNLKTTAMVLALLQQ
jgi:hypothetical protein